MACILDGNNSRQILMAIETASIVQFVYFSLIGIGELNPLFIALAQGLKLSNGYDLNLSNIMTNDRTLLGLWIDSANISDNVNVSVAAPALFLVIGLLLFIASKIKNRNKKH